MMRPDVQKAHEEVPRGVQIRIDSARQREGHDGNPTGRSGPRHPAREYQDKMGLERRLRPQLLSRRSAAVQQVESLSQLVDKLLLFLYGFDEDGRDL